MLQSREYFHSLIQQEIADGVPADRIVLGGFSQGGAMSIFSGLTAPVKLGAIVGLSSWLLLSQTFKEHVPEGNINKDTPIFMGHGDQDPLVRYDLAQASEKALKAMGYGVDFKTYRYVCVHLQLTEANAMQRNAALCLLGRASGRRKLFAREAAPERQLRKSNSVAGSKNIPGGRILALCTAAVGFWSEL